MHAYLCCVFSKMKYILAKDFFHRFLNCRNDDWHFLTSGIWTLKCCCGVVVVVCVVVVVVLLLLLLLLQKISWVSCVQADFVFCIWVLSWESSNPSTPIIFHTCFKTSKPRQRKTRPDCCWVVKIFHWQLKRSLSKKQKCPGFINL